MVVVVVVEGEEGRTRRRDATIAACLGPAESLPFRTASAHCILLRTATNSNAAAAVMDTAKKKSKRTNRTANTGGPIKDKVKAVIRRLPPNLPEDVFWQSVQPWVSDDAVLMKSFSPGKVRKAYNKLSTPSRAYIAFKSGEQLLAFSQAYDGHTFRDKAGQETHAVVEFAPCQKVPSEKKKVDSRLGTIEQGGLHIISYTRDINSLLLDDDFMSFIASLKAPIAKPGDSENLELLGMYHTGCTLARCF